MISYEELVTALDELNGRVPARPKQELKPKVSGGLPKAQSQPAMNAVAAEEQFDDVDFSIAMPAAVAPVTTEVPELGDAFEVLTEEPLPPASQDVEDDAFDILSEAELPPPPPEASSQGDLEVLGDQAFSGFFDENAPVDEAAPGAEEDLFDLPTPPPEGMDVDMPPPPEDDFDLPPPPPA
ncbi:MAG: hypothetical protein CVU65_12700 [Deltaproteobacteria bacterium HGW-Deltaproteobacteria-22]|jgi:hypothetical protein|nr:MAG: hypothetical protein CVU65_12700 [Deltaproteobacteria bacterium HGW-Deltaproteobacteria-22]